MTSRTAAVLITLALGLLGATAGGAENVPAQPRPSILPAADRPAGADEVKLSAAYGFGESFDTLKAKEHCWTPVTAQVEFAPADQARLLDAELRLLYWSNVEGELKQLSCTRRLKMGAGKKAATLYYAARDESGPDGKNYVELTLVDRATGAELARVNPLPPQTAQFLASEAERLVLLAGKDRLGLRLSVPQPPADGKRKAVDALADALLPQNWPHVLALSEEQMPDSWIGYDGIVCLVWDCAAPEKLRPAQVQAVKDWVLRGGRLALTFDPLRPWEPGSLAELLPARAEGSAEVRFLKTVAISKTLMGKKEDFYPLPLGYVQAFSGLWEYPCRLRDEVPGLFKTDDGPKYFLTTRLRPTSGTVLFPLPGADGEPILVQGGYGAGTVVMVAPDLSQWPFVKYPGNADFAARALGLLPGGAKPPEGYNWNRSSTPWRVTQNSDHDSLLSSDRAAQNYTQETPTLRAAPLWLIAVFFCAYVLVAGPLDYFLLRRRDRLKLTWLTLPLYAALFSALAYGGAYLLRGGKTFSRSVCLRDEYAGAGRACNRAFIGIFNSIPGNCDVSFGERAWPEALGEQSFAGEDEAAPRFNSSDYNGDDENAERDFTPEGMAESVAEDEGGEFKDMPLHKWSMRNFASASFDDRYIVAGNVRYEGDRLAGEIKNVGGDVIEGALLIGRHGVRRVGTLTPGQRWTPEGGENAFGFLEYCMLLGGGDDDALELAPAKTDTEPEPDSDEGPTASDAGQAADDRALEWQTLTEFHRVSLRALLQGYLEHRRDLDRLQFTQPGFSGINFYQLLDHTGADRIPYGERQKMQERAERLPQPLAGISFEQAWDDRDWGGSKDRFASDLSGHVWRGGLYLIGLVRAARDRADVSGRQLEREGITVLRVIFPGAGGTASGKAWQDDLYRSGY